VLQRYACSLEDHAAADRAQRAEEAAKQLRSDVDRMKAPLLARFNPQLRLCLLAEVAAGLLVPG
jgi:hypothetical protein